MLKNKSKLKIAVITGTFPSVSETFVTNQINGLMEMGQQVDFFCLRYDDNVKNMSKFDARIISIKALTPKRFINRFKDILLILYNFRLKFLWPALKTFNLFKYGINGVNGIQFFKAYYLHYFKLNNYDVIQVHFANNAVTLLPLLRMFKGKIIVTFHGYDAHNFDKIFYTDLIKLNTIRYTVNTKYTLEKVVNLGVERKLITVIPVAINPIFLQPYSKSKQTNSIIKILFVGRFVEFKAPLLAIKIIEEVLKIKPNINFKMVGSGPKFNCCLSYLKLNGLENKIQLMGSMPQKNIIEVMKTSDIFLYPGIVASDGRCENQGLVIQEAQAMQLPVLISDVGGMKYGMIDGETGFVLDSEDIDAFVQKINWLISHPERNKLMQKKAREFVLERYSLDKHIKDLMDMLYDS